MVYNPKAVIPHAVSLGQAFAHCRKFLVAATRRCRHRVSVTLWPIKLSLRLPVIDLVGYYPANNLMGRRLLFLRLATFILRSHAVLPRLSASYPPQKGRFLRITHPSAAVLYCYKTARLACLRHTASVHPEPGSNSQKNLIFKIISKKINGKYFTTFTSRKIPVKKLPTTV